MRIRIPKIEGSYTFGFCFGWGVGNALHKDWHDVEGAVLIYLSAILIEVFRDLYDNNKRDIRPTEAWRDFPGSNDEGAELPRSDGGNPDLRMRESKGRWN